MIAPAPLRAFHGDPAIKAKYVERMREHIAADELVRGVGWEDGRGCAIGCTLNRFDHHGYEEELGIPEWIAHLQDRMFEHMSEDKAHTWPLLFLEAIPVGADLNRRKPTMLIYILGRASKCFDETLFPDVASVVQTAIDVWKRDDIGSENWREAASNAALLSDQFSHAADMVFRDAVDAGDVVAAWGAAAASDTALAAGCALEGDMDAGGVVKTVAAAISTMANKAACEAGNTDINLLQKQRKIIHDEVADHFVAMLAAA